ncbi:zinc finger CCHC domain-containing protein 14 [Lampris incognitus]|uniref:zinc finger CCHC domain-containing protein 14 n=1 Tax=Lampris incognitus TaxID=2546036 RepID=UPI0024B5D46B|nr:zinc finger CCHC domain-containing protein 14 [Lampris incognitus]
MVENRCWVQREGVYRWFSSLTSAQRAEFLCGLLDLCVPIELRFLGSCLEDLARKDYHSLRDAEIKANNPADLSGLTNITDEVVRSKLLVSLALLSSDNREAAGVLYRTLTHIDTVINNYGLPLNDGRTEEQFLLLFTMASNHPAFSFHQKHVLRQELGQIQEILQVSSGGREVQGARLSGDQTAVCYTHHHHHHQMTVPFAASCALPSANASYLPLPTCQPCHAHCSCSHKSQAREAGTGSGLGSEVAISEASISLLTHPPPPRPSPLPSGSGQDGPVPNQSHLRKTGKVVIERVELRGVTQKIDDTSEYVLEVTWSDGCTSAVVRTRHEATELLSQLSQVFPDDGLEKFLSQPLELDPRCLTVLPCHILQHHSVHLFFTSTTPQSPVCTPSLPSPLPPLPSSPPMVPVAPACTFTSSTNLGCLLQYRGANRAVYGVASIQPVVSAHSSMLTRSLPHLSSLPPSLPPLPPSIPPPQHSPQLSSLPPPLVPAQPAPGSMTISPSCGVVSAGGDTSSQPQSQLQSGAQPQTGAQTKPHPQSQHPSHSPAQSHSHSQLGPLPSPHSQSHAQSPSQSQSNTPEQNGILDWLRRLRLHKYYPVFKQLTMEEFLALTEEDLNKYDLTQGAKKKLKTQLELQNREMKMEKRYMASQFPGSCSGIARVTPSSHMGPLSHPTSATELRVEVDASSHHHPVLRDGSSSSGYSSSPCSPRTPLCRDMTFDRTRDIHRRTSGPDTAGGGSEKDRSCVVLLNSGCPTGSSRPTAQVLPVQTDPVAPLPPPCSSHLPFSLPQSPQHPQASYPQTFLSPGSNPARILASPRKPRPPLLCPEDRNKPLGSGLPGTGAGFGVGVGLGHGPTMGMGIKLENLFPGLNMDGSSPIHPSSPLHSSSSLQDSVVCRGLVGGAVGPRVETSSALTSTSNSLHHFSHPPLHFHLSSSSSPTPSRYYSYPSTSSCFSSISSTSFPSYSSSASTKSGPLSGSSSGGGGFVPLATGGSIPMAAVHGTTYCPPPPTTTPSPSPLPSCSLEGPVANQGSGHASSVCVCSSCGCRGNCGAYGTLPGYAAAGYLQPISAGPSLFTLGPLLHLSPLITTSSTVGAAAAPFSYPLVAPPPIYRHSPLSHDQQGFSLYQPHGSIVGAGGQKRLAGNLSCYNCGASGHRADDCKQPPMDSMQQGMFRLKYTPHLDNQDSGE